MHPETTSKIRSGARAFRFNAAAASRFRSRHACPFTHAVKWYEAAAQRAHPQAICTLGFCYAKGHGVEKNEVLACGVGGESG